MSSIQSPIQFKIVMQAMYFKICKDVGKLHPRSGKEKEKCSFVEMQVEKSVAFPKKNKKKTKLLQ